MEHFPIVFALARAALRERNPAVIQHVERLRQALVTGGDQENANALTGVIEAARKSVGAMTPTKVVLARAMAHGDQITPNTHPPVDRETSTPLAEIWTVERLAHLEPPIWGARLDRAVKELVGQWESADALLNAGVKVPRSTLLFGSPGTGKTQLALWVARRLGMPVVLARLDGLTSSFLGTTARNVRALFDFANRYRCVLLLDEFDGIAKVRDDPHELGEVKRVVNAVLQAIDSRSQIGLTIAITNHERLLDPAVWRRFDARLHIEVPDAEVRKQIIERYMRPLDVTEGVVRVLTWMSDEFSGSEIEAMCSSIKRHMTLRADADPSFLDALELFLDMSATTHESSARDSLRRGRDHWARAALQNDQVTIKQNDLAEVMGVGQSRVSKMARKVAKV